MDELLLQVKTEKDKEGKLPEAIYVEILVNGKLITEGSDYPVDIRQLLLSVENEGDHEFWTCTCGVGGCAGIDKGIVVKHSETSVTWTIEELPFLSNAQFSFEKNAYKQQIINCIIQLKAEIADRKRDNLSFEFYPDPGITRINEIIF